MSNISTTDEEFDDDQAKEKNPRTIRELEESNNYLRQRLDELIIEHESMEKQFQNELRDTQQLLKQERDGAAHLENRIDSLIETLKIVARRI